MHDTLHYYALALSSPVLLCRVFLVLLYLLMEVLILVPARIDQTRSHAFAPSCVEYPAILLILFRSNMDAAGCI